MVCLLPDPHLSCALSKKENLSSELILSQREEGLHKRTEPIISAPPTTGSNKNQKKKKRKGKKERSSN